MRKVAIDNDRWRPHILGMISTEQAVGFPERHEAAPYYFKVIERIPDPDVVGVLETQLEDAALFLAGISDERSGHRYEPGKWSIRQVVSHLADSERVFLFRALWFARGFTDPLPSYDQHVCADAARAHELPWKSIVEELLAVRRASVLFFRNLPQEAWAKSGIASDNSFTVRALAYVLAGHWDHHLSVIEERYL